MPAWWRTHPRPLRPKRPEPAAEATHLMFQPVCVVAGPAPPAPHTPDALATAFLTVRVEPP